MYQMDASVLLLLLPFVISCLIIAAIITRVRTKITTDTSRLVKIGLLLGLIIGTCGVTGIYLLCLGSPDAVEGGCIFLLILGLPLTLLEFILENTPIIKGTTSSIVSLVILFIFNWVILGGLISYLVSLFLRWKTEKQIK